MVSNIHHLYYYSYSNNYFPGINDFLNSSNGLEKIESSVKKRSSSAKGILIFDYYYLILNFFFQIHKQIMIKKEKHYQNYLILSLKSIQVS
jgi:hypothetical protein